MPPSAHTVSRAVFLDRDGTLIEDRNYLRRPEEVVILLDAAAALTRLQAAGFKLVIVSNQSGVGRGYFTLADVERVNQHLLGEFSRQGVRFEKVYIAPGSARGAEPRTEAVAAIPVRFAGRIRPGPGAKLHDRR